MRGRIWNDAPSESFLPGTFSVKAGCAAADVLTALAIALR
jgi:hypothetical protein